ncbi:MAG: asparaginase domain-containing protein [Fretibacterium sp.]|nr:asparaginase domain-containing protein [Fretibacterium sp.]
MENRDKVVVLLAGGRVVQRQAMPSVQPDLKEEELNALLSDQFREHTTFQKWSLQPVSNYTLRMCSEIISMAASYINNDGAKGVIVTCGIEGIAELAYFADLIWDLNPPLVFTGSLFNAGSRGSETSIRLEQSVQAVMSGFCTGKGALLCIQDAIYSPADVLQICSFRRNILAFPDAPLAVFAQPSGELLPLRSPRRRQVLSLGFPLARNIEILNASLGDGDLMLKALLDKRFEELDGLVISGLGDGDVPSGWVPLIRKLVRTEIPIVLASRPGGRVQDAEDFEGSASQLLEFGLLDAGMLSPYQARLRLAVGLSAGLKGEDLARYMKGEQ